MGASAGASEEVYHVPWQVAEGEATRHQGLILYWFPASAEEVKISPLRTSRTLAILSGQCVAMQLAGAGSPIGKQLDVQGAPETVLATPAGASLGRVAGENGRLDVGAVEKLVSDEVKRREDAIKKQLDDAKAKSKAGEAEAATELFKSVWAERCLFPRKAKDAAKELKKLGAPVAETSDLEDAPAPRLDAATSAHVIAVMTKGLHAENKGHYAEAERRYSEARRMDPGDPTPLRYLGELYRHQIGDWVKARQNFDELLAMPTLDPLSRAVALHGLGKMTIHEGSFQRGLQLFEDSVRAFPIALTYRNLAVYWNSEGDPAKTAHYVDLALKLEPEETYNLIFAAVFMAQSGRGDEALALARAHQALLPASYNLAAVYAQLGQRDVALRLLRRHFYEYERFTSVRRHEMMEARVDAVFLSIRQDPEFVQLTALADGMLQPMPATPASR